MALLGYARVSTVDQELALQTDALTEAGCDRIWTDQASGKTLAGRPGLDALLDHARAGDVLVVWRLDRLGRALDVAGLLDDLEKRGIAFRSLTESWDTGSASGRLLIGIMLCVARAEREVLVERTKAGLAAARSRGRTGGRPSVMTPAKQRAATRLLAEPQATVKDVAEAVGVSRSSLTRWLARRA
jgi:DNA invertase Pin-like site-specific DNA recombinase